MPALDPLAKLKALSKSETGASPFTHESEETILRQLLGILTQVPTGKELVDKSILYGTQIKLLKGKNDFSFAPESNTVFVGIPATQGGAKARMLLYLTMGLEEARQEFEGMPRPNLTIPFDQLNALHVEKQRKIHFLMIKAAHEMINSLGLREILDELEKMGHIDLYKAFEEDLRSAS